MQIEIDMATSLAAKLTRAAYFSSEFDGMESDDEPDESDDDEDVDGATLQHEVELEVSQDDESDEASAGEDADSEDSDWTEQY